jgi:MoaA/NifB/PqqE/SkfB family radical SAM enzyme
LGLDNILLLKTKYNFNFGINITLCKINEDNFRDYLYFIEKWKPNIVNVQFLTPFGNAENLANLEQNIEKCSNILKEEISNFSYDINIINLPFCYMQ